MTKDIKFNWRARHALEVTLRLALGQTQAQIAAQFGCSHSTIRSRVRREGLSRKLTDEEALAMTHQIERARLLEELLDTEPGSPAQARLRAALKDISRATEGLSASDAGAPRDFQDMSDEELEAYVEALAPRLGA